MMVIQNFRIEDNYAITRGEDCLDLHNDYDFQAFGYDSVANSLTLKWSRASEHSAKATCARVSLRFENLLFLKTEFQAASDMPLDAKTLAFVGFLHPDDSDVMDGCLLYEEADATYHLIIRFENGLAIKCFSEVVICDFE